MKKSRLTKILVEGNPTILKDLSTQVEDTMSIQMERSPKTSLVMMKARDSVSMQPFHMGEVLVTECTVSIQRAFGIGVLMGEEPERSYQIAVVDAAFNAELPFTKTWISTLEQEELNIRERHLKESAIVSRSQVNFNTMEDYNDKS
ncbi:phosphonate C-P lyase system protein PhnG [Metabacillus herbersteinensis]|uniref:Phosphonate C-P lyase system protein PhnG n=1 Tax=Metabacillus herbersteinensis TaxID=283816 RepID=A0ABV6GDL3_9BACI